MRYVLATLASALVALLAAAQDSPPNHASDSPVPRSSLLVRHYDEKPPLLFELIPTEASPGAILTNTNQETLTAFALEIDPEPDSKRPSQIMVFDALTRVGLPSTIPRGLSYVMGIPHVAGKPVPSHRIVAAIWENGSTFGPEDLLKQIFANRRATLAAHDIVISILEKGLQEDWRNDQYLSALEKEKLPLPTLTEVPRVSLSFQPNTTLGMAARSLRTPRADKTSLLVKGILDFYKKQRDLLAGSFPADSQNATAP